MKQIIAQSALRNGRVDLCTDTGERLLLTSGKHLENPPLAFSQIMSHTMRSYIPTWQKPDTHCSPSFHELWFWVTST